MTQKFVDSVENVSPLGEGQPGDKARQPYQAPELKELGPIHELTRGDVGPDDDLGTTRVA